MKSINRFLIEQGFTTNNENITIGEMVDLVDKWQIDIRKSKLEINNNENDFRSGDLVEVINESPYKGVRLYVYKVRENSCVLTSRRRFYYNNGDDSDSRHAMRYGIEFKNKELKLIKRNK